MKNRMGLRPSTTNADGILDSHTLGLARRFACASVSGPLKLNDPVLH